MIKQSGFGYFASGLSLVTQKGIKRFVLIPLAVNFLLFSVAFYYLLSELASWRDTALSYLPDWLTWLEFIFWPLAVIVIIVGFSFIFSAAANWIAAPFNGLLAEKVEQHLTGHTPTGTLMDTMKDVPRMIGREWKKLTYYLPRMMLFLILLFSLPVAGQILWVLFSAWMMSVQYCDYPFDNHKVGFRDMLRELKQRKGLSFSFGITVMLASSIPVVNLFVMPVAICGATNLWVCEYRQKFTS